MKAASHLLWTELIPSPNFLIKIIIYYLSNSNIFIIFASVKTNNMWVAKDKNGNLYIFNVKPIRLTEYWYSEEVFMYIGKRKYSNLVLFKQFEHLTWRDEPIEVELKF